MASARQHEKPFILDVNPQAGGVAMIWSASFAHGGGRVEHASSVAPRNEGRNPEVACGLAIAQGTAVRKRHRSASCRYERMASCHVPLAGGAKSRVNVGSAFRDPAEFKCRAAGHPAPDIEPNQQRVSRWFKVRSSHPRNDS